MLMPIFKDKDNFVQRCVELSENVDNYINNKLYLADVDDPKLVDQLFLTTNCLDIILGELADRGIIFENNASEFMELLHDREIPLQLRKRFEPDMFFEIVRKLSDESRQALMNEFEYADEQLGARLCVVMSSILPTDAAWDYIAQHSFLFITNNNFKDTMQAVVEKAIYEPPAPLPIERDIKDIATWMKGEQEHQVELKNLLMRVAERLYLNAGDNESSVPLKNELLKKMEKYDWDHRTPAFIAKLMANPKAEEEDEPFHQQRNDHHIQYYFQHKGITWPQIVMVACTAASKSAGDVLRPILAGNEQFVTEGQLQLEQEDINKIADVLNVAETIWNEMKREKEAANGATV